MATNKSKDTPIGDVLRQKRVDVLKKGLREMAKILEIAPAHLTDLEKGRRTPSDGLLMRIAREYGVDEADLRAGWNRADTVVSEIATQDPTTAAKVPEFLRSARKLSLKQWDALIRQAKQMSPGKGRKAGG